MTNADKYLKNGVTVEQMRQDYNKTGQELRSVFEWLYAPIKTTLSEDEKVILRNIQFQPVAIGRDEDNDLELKYFEKGIRYDCFPEYNHLFQFIQPRRRIRYKGVDKR